MNARILTHTSSPKSARVHVKTQIFTLIEDKPRYPRLVCVLVDHSSIFELKTFKNPLVCSRGQVQQLLKLNRVRYNLLPFKCFIFKTLNQTLSKSTPEMNWHYTQITWQRPFLYLELLELVDGVKLTLHFQVYSSVSSQSLLLSNPRAVRSFVFSLNVYFPCRVFHSFPGSIKIKFKI